MVEKDLEEKLESKYRTVRDIFIETCMDPDVNIETIKYVKDQYIKISNELTRYNLMRLYEDEIERNSGLDNINSYLRNLIIYRFRKFI